MTETELRKYYMMVTQAWELFRQYQDITAQDERQWEVLVAEADAIYKQNGSSPFAKALVIAIMDELERRVTNERKT